VTWLRRNMMSWKSINAQQMAYLSSDDLSFIDG
jgi:hypothetical protein